MAKKNLRKSRPEARLDETGTVAIESSKPNSRPRKKKDGAVAEAQLSHFEKYEIVEVHRSELKNAPYNPRVISQNARRRLKEKIESVGLIDPPIWNRITGHIVGGHQRVSILDALHKTKNYRLRVAAVELDLKTEKETNLFLNNENAQGDWDMELLDKMFKENEISAEAAGFDLGDIFRTFGEQAASGDAKEMIEYAESFRAMTERADRAAEKAISVDDPDFYCVLVFRSTDDKLTFLHTLDLADPDNQAEDGNYIDGRLMWRALINSGLVVDEEAVEGEIFEQPIKKCPRCACKHSQIQWRAFESPDDVSAHQYWAMCPQKAEPVFYSELNA